MPGKFVPEPDHKNSASGAVDLRGRLFRKYALLFAGMISGALIGSGLLDAWFSYREQSALLARIQQEQADAAADKISRFVGEIERQVVWATQLPWTPDEAGARRREALRLLRLAPAITELKMLDGAGHEQLALSRLSNDQIGSLTDRSTEPEPETIHHLRAHSRYLAPQFGLFSLLNRHSRWPFPGMVSR